MNYFRCHRLLFLLLLSPVLFPLAASAQQLSAADKASLKKKEDSLQHLSVQMVMAPEAAERFRADSQFVRTFVRALQMPGSFNYAFDSLSISRLYAPDSSFRIYTWQLKKDEYVIMQKGAIQMKTANGSLKLYPLFDASMYTKNPMDSLRSRNQWIGAIYYKIVMKENKGKKYYTLLGFDDFSVASNKKWMDVLHFDAAGEPQFGGNLISFDEDSVRKAPQHRFSIEYKKEARAYLNYDPELDMIIVDHLVSETDEPNKKSTYIPDGDYEAFKWKNGKWVHVSKLFNQMRRDGDFPKEALILDDAGKANEQKLEEQSRKNYERSQKGKPAAPSSKTPVKKKP